MAFKKPLLGHILVLACALPILAQAQGGPGFQEMPQGGPMPPPPGIAMVPPMPPPFMTALRAIQLTPDQQSKLRRIMDSERSQSEAAMNHLHSIHEQITDKLLGTGSVSEAELAPLSREANEIDQQVQERSLNTALRVRAFLTVEQLAKMSQFHQQVTSINAQIEKLMQGTPLNIPPR